MFTAGQAPPPAHNLGIIPEHLAEGIAELDAGRDEGLDSGTNHSADQTVYHIDVESNVFTLLYILLQTKKLKI